VSSEEFELTPEHLRVTCDPESLRFETTAELPKLEGIIGQERAMTALSFGMEMDAKGYNIFIAGPTGTGRNYAAVTRCRAAATKRSPPEDWTYTYNFRHPQRPRALRLAPGRGPEFARDIEELVATCQQEIPRAFESETYEDRKEKATGDVQAERSRILQELDEIARSEGFMIQATPMGLVTVPLLENRPMSREQFEELSEQKRTEINQKMDELRGKMQDSLGRARQLEKEARQRIQYLDREIAMAAVGDQFDQIQQKYAEYPDIVEHLKEMAEDIVAHQAEFRSTEPSDGRAESDIPTRYRVNVFVTSEECDGAPVIEENSPTYYNLFGRLEYRPVAGGALTDHMLIKPGAMHRANGGYLIMQMMNVLTAPFTWDALKRSLRSQEVTIENIGEQWTPVPAATLRPEPIPLDIKVILIGSPLLYFLLYSYDEEFGKLFRVKAEFDIDMPLEKECCQDFAQFIGAHCRKNDLRPCDNTAVASLMNYAMRLAEDQRKLSTRTTTVSEVVDEANFLAEEDGAEVISEAHIEAALGRREYRVKRIEARVNEMIERGDLVVDVAGERIAQVNGLAVLDTGDHAFGRPSRITARVSPGRAGIVDIERESRLSGQIHQKAVMILSGYLMGKYGAETPLSVSATIAFEQSYGPVEGDSASCAELYAILSGLAQVPVRQGIAVTGSVDQHGNIQVIGGANFKIEGFFTACKLKGITGEQGVIIPRQNIKNLMLKREVIDAVEQGKFHIWAVSNVDEGIEVLTGVPAGSPEDPDSIHGKVRARLEEFADALRGARDERPPTIIEVPPGAGAPRPPHPPTPPREPPTPPPPPVPPT